MIFETVSAYCLPSTTQVHVFIFFLNSLGVHPHRAVSAHRDAEDEGGVGGHIQQATSPQTIKTDQHRAFSLGGRRGRHLLLRAPLDADWSKSVGGRLCLLVRTRQAHERSLHTSPCCHGQDTASGV